LWYWELTLALVATFGTTLIANEGRVAHSRKEVSHPS